MESQKKTHIHKNIMEELVSEEISRQINKYPQSVNKYFNPVEVATYALNRLPPLYASSHKGLNQQQRKAKTNLSRQITKAVRQGFAAVQQDLLRSSTPLTKEEDAELEAAKAALKELTEYLPANQFSWTNIVNLIKPILQNLSYYKSNRKDYKTEELELPESDTYASRSSNFWDKSDF